MKIDAKVSKGEWSMCFIYLDDQLGQEIIAKFGKRIICKTETKQKIHAAIHNDKKVGYYIMLGKASRKKLGIKENQEFVLKIEADKSTYQFEVPTEFQEVISTDEAALVKFENLTPGRKRSILHYVGSAVRSDTRISRALRIAENLTLGYKDLRDLVKNH